MRSLILASVVFLTACCVSEEEFSEQAQDAAACSDGDTCVLAGGSDCLCARPINASKAAEIEALAQEVCCEGRAVSCVPFLNVRCQDGRCQGNLPE